VKESAPIGDGGIVTSIMTSLLSFGLRFVCLVLEIQERQSSIENHSVEAPFATREILGT
jgi:hypothetical protein